MLTERIYYVDEKILDIISKDFDLIETASFYELLQCRKDKTFWRLDAWDKYQERFIVRLDTIENWVNYDSKELQIGLLLQTRSASDNKCIWNKCEKPSLKGLVYCERHAYEDMGIRK